MKITLELNTSDTSTFEKAFDSIDDNFTITDSIYWLLDYGEDGETATHHTKYGDIKISVE